MNGLINDLRYAARKLFHNPGFTLVAVLALALGVGATTSIFSVVNAVLIRPLPFQRPERLVVLWENNLDQGRQRDQVSAATFLDWRETSSSFQEMAAWAYWGLTLTGDEEPERIATIRSSASLFSLLGVEAAYGRTFAPEEDKQGQHRVAVISHGLWQRRYGADVGIVGRRLTLDGEAYTVVGVMPRGFRFPDDDDVDMWVPMAFTEGERSSRALRMFNILGRLRDGVTLQEAQAEMDAIAHRLARQYPGTNAGWGVTMMPATELHLASYRHLLLILGAVGFLLLIACANVASLLLARAVDREGELAIRQALGAGRLRLGRQLLVESLLLAVAGGTAALVVAVWSTDLLLTIDPDSISRWNEVRIDANVLAFAAAVSLGTALLAGMIPALHAARPRLLSSLRRGSGGLTGRHTVQGLRGLLVVLEIGLAVVLLIGSGLLIRSFARLLDAPAGFDPENVLIANIYLAEGRYPEEHRQLAFFRVLVERVQGLPGVVEAAVTTAVPLDPVGVDFDLPFVLEGQAEPPAGKEPQADYRVISPEYLEVVGIPLLRGRRLTWQDRDDAPRVMLINRTMARRYFAGEDPLGKRLRIPIGGWHEIVGVVGDVRHRGLDAEPRPELYVSVLQQPFSGMVLCAKTAADPTRQAETVKREIFALDPNLATAQLTNMEELVSSSIGDRRFNTILLGAFAALALVLAVVGIYGVVSYGVSQRTREIGVRMALGARGQDVLWTVLSQGGMLVALGLGLGVAGAGVVSRLLRSLLYEVHPLDPVTFLAVPLLLAAVALAATCIPAIRAARVDPVLALRYE